MNETDSRVDLVTVLAPGTAGSIVLLTALNQEFLILKPEPVIPLASAAGC